MKIILASIIGFTSLAPAIAGEYQPGYSTTRVCTRNEYREEYIPGDKNSPGYVKSWDETVEVPCNSSASTTFNRSVQSNQAIDNNDCSQGTIIGGLLGAGLAGMGTRGKDRWLTVPAGAVGGAMIGCQVDGG